MFKLIFITLLYYCLSEVAGAEPASPLRQQPRIFPNKLWVFWNSDINKAPIFTQLCVNNIRHYAEISGWELILLNNENIYEYLTSDSSLKILDIRDKRSDLLIQALADIYRIFILHDNGGMWLDITSVLLHDLSWVENIGN
jgi:mannosyltransferase OCH1-like enzyme